MRGHLLFLLISLIAIIIGGLGLFVFLGGFVAISTGSKIVTITMLIGGALMIGLAIWLYRHRNHYNK